MQMETINQIVILAIFGVLLVMFLGPPLVLGVLYVSDRRQKQHAVLPTLIDEMGVEREPGIATRHYAIEEEGLFSR